MRDSIFKQLFHFDFETYFCYAFPLEFCKKLREKVEESDLIITRLGKKYTNN